MTLFDLPLTELEQYLPPRREPANFTSFWHDTLTEGRAFDRAVQVRPFEGRLPLVEVLDLSFAGFGGQRVHCWWIGPAATPPETGWPTVVSFIGYGGGRGTPLDWLTWPVAGFAVLVVDTRGQGARGQRPGSTGDAVGSANPHVEGFLTKGITDPHGYYYRRVFTDAALAVDVARSLPGADPARIAVCGRSQGGAIALAATALADGVVASLVDVPFLCHVERAIEIVDTHPYAELLEFARTRRAEITAAFETLAYFDGMILAAHGTAPALFSVGLMDTVCPPSTVYAAYNHYAGPKHIEVYPYNQHEGGGEEHTLRQISWLQDQLGAAG